MLSSQLDFESHWSFSVANIQ